MYSNKVSIAVTEHDCFLKFEFIGPIIKDDGTVDTLGLLESQLIVMDKDMLKKLRGLINETIGADSQENSDEQ